MIVRLSKGEAIAKGFGVHIMISAVSVLIGLICCVTLYPSALSTADRRQIEDDEALPYYPIKGKEVRERLLRISMISHSERFI